MAIIISGRLVQTVYFNYAVVCSVGVGEMGRPPGIYIKGGRLIKKLLKTAMGGHQNQGVCPEHLSK